MGDFAGVEIGHSDDHDCGTCGMPVKEKGGCCHDDVKVIKVVQDQSAATFAIFSFGIAKSLPANSYFSFQAPVPIALIQAAPAHAPPLISEQDLYLQHRVFRI